MYAYWMGFGFGFAIGCSIIGAWSMWLSSRDFKEYMRLLERHEDWLRKKIDEYDES